MPTVSFEVMSISCHRQSLVLVLPAVGNVRVRGGDMQPAEYCLMNIFDGVLGRVLWEGSASICCPCVVVGI